LNADEHFHRSSAQTATAAKKLIQGGNLVLLAKQYLLWFGCEERSGAGCCLLQ
jgi:hypothetical protein